MADNYYTILGVAPDANDQQIKKAYRKLSLETHPDKNNDPAAHETFKKASEAYEILSDGEKRRMYDMQRQQNGQFPFPGGGFPPGFPGGVFQGGVFPGMFPFGGVDLRVHHNGGNGPQLDEIFQHFFNGQGGENVRIFQNGKQVGGQPRKPPAIEKEIQITLEQAYNGFVINLEIERKLYVNNQETKETDSIPVTVPKGVDHKENIIICEKGNVSQQNVKGDIILIFIVAPHDVFVRRGINLYCKRTISLKDALCHFSIEIPHLSGKMLRLTNQTQSTIVTPGHIKEIPNYGMEIGNEKGLLILEFAVEFPTSLTPEQKTIIEKTL